MFQSFRTSAAALCAVTALLLTGANYRTENFAVSAPTVSAARQVAEAAERYRSRLANEWLGAELPRWASPCPIRVDDDATLPTTGRTSFSFRAGAAVDWEMSLVGPLPEVIDCVLPHEVMHTVLATHFGRPLPRWADEGTCTIVEHPAEVARHQQMIAALVRRKATVSLARLFATERYPRDPIPFYMQSFSVSSYLIEQGGRRKFLDFLHDANRTRDWNAAVVGHYGLQDLAALENAWLHSLGQTSEPSPETLENVISAASVPFLGAQPLKRRTVGNSP